MSKLLEAARHFACLAHKGQKRKYTDESYVRHLESVARLVHLVGLDDEVVAAAWLHDTVEDTPVTLAQIEAKFGRKVARLVGEVTDKSKPTDGNRAKRKAIDRAHNANASPDGMSIKLADLIDNTTNIVARDPAFAKVYLAEKAELLPLLKAGNNNLWDWANWELERGLKTLKKGEK